MRQGGREGGGQTVVPSCVLAIGGGRLVGVGQVRVRLSAGYAVQFCLYVPQAQFGGCVGSPKAQHQHQQPARNKIKPKTQ